MFVSRCDVPIVSLCVCLFVCLFVCVVVRLTQWSGRSFFLSS